MHQATRKRPKFQAQEAYDDHAKGGETPAVEQHRFQYRACEGHTHERNHPDVTIQTYWDSDRLDLGRGGITPHPSRLCSEVAKQPATIKWADERATFGFVPKFVLEEWGMHLV